MANLVFCLGCTERKRIIQLMPWVCEEYEGLVSIDEATYDPEKSPMGEDHPLVWWHEVGEGQVFYSALGHTTTTYQEPQFRQFMRGAIVWGLVEAEKKEADNKEADNKEPDKKELN